MSHRIEFQANDGEWWPSIIMREWTTIQEGAQRPYRLIDTKTGFIEREWHPDTQREIVHLPPETALQKVQKTLSRITFAPSCVTMNWMWEVRELEANGGFLVRTTVQCPDRDTGAMVVGFGRWWHVPADVSESSLVKTAYIAVRVILEHELMESFRYEGDRVFDPHHDMQDLRAAAQHRRNR